MKREPTQAHFDEKAIESLKAASSSILTIANELKANREVYRATDLPVAEAVEHVLSCLEKDSAYLSKLAEICTDSVTNLKQFSDD